MTKKRLLELTVRKYHLEISYEFFIWLFLLKGKQHASLQTIITNLTTMTTICLFFLNASFLFCLASTQSSELINSRKKLITKVTEDLKEGASIKCLNYIVDSVSNQHLITDLSVPMKIFDHKEIRLNQLS